MTVPYYCARDNMSIGISDCMKNFKNIDIPTLVNQTKRYAENGLVDPTRYMINHKVYIFDGLNDSTVMPGQVTYMMLITQLNYCNVFVNLCVCPTPVYQYHSQPYLTLTALVNLRWRTENGSSHKWVTGRDINMMSAAMTQFSGMPDPVPPIRTSSDFGEQHRVQTGSRNITTKPEVLIT